MCNPGLLVLFISLCNFHLNSNIKPDVTLQNCVKAFDICVDRELWEYEDTLINSSEKEKQEAAIDSCDYLLLNRQEYSSYYTDIRCGYNN